MIELTKEIQMEKAYFDFKNVSQVSCQTWNSTTVPTIEYLLNKLSGGIIFTKIGLSQVYRQLALSPESRKYTIIKSDLAGLTQHKLLTCGASFAVFIF